MSPADVQRVAQRLFDGRARVVVEVQPAAKAKPVTKRRAKGLQAVARSQPRSRRGELA